MSTNIVLTIAIPTYNRLELLKECVKAFVDQIQAIGSKSFTIELLVINNASNDGTDKWLENYFNDKVINSRYVNSPENIGAVPNVIRCIEESRGLYVWIFGDDDFPLPYAVQRILDLINNSGYDDVSLFYMNSIRSDYYMKTYGSMYEQSIELKPEKITIDELADRFHLHLGLIITLLFKKDIWLKGKSFYSEQYYGYGFLGALLYGCKGGKCLYYSFPQSIHRVGTQRYSNEVPLYVLSGIPRMFDDLYKLGAIKTEPLKSWQSSFSTLDFIKVLTIAKAFNYKADHFIWNESLQFLNSRVKRTLIFIFRYIIPPFIARALYNYGSVVKN